MTPRTLSELRAAVARVLLARGEAADSVRVKASRSRGKHAVSMSATRPGWHPFAGCAVQTSEFAAVEEAWAHVERWIRDEHGYATDAVAAADVRLARANAALAVAREIGGGE